MLTFKRQRYETSDVLKMIVSNTESEDPLIYLAQIDDFGQ